MAPKHGAVQNGWPKEAYTSSNAGVTLIGCSARHGGAPAVLLGGRFYTGRKEYSYTDFGGGVDRKRGETPQQGAFRELAEELLAQGEEEARATASRLCDATAPELVGGRPFVHKAGYVLFVAPAEAVAGALQLPAAARGTSAIDHLFDSAQANSELSSMALVSVEELLRGSRCGRTVRPLGVRQLDGQDRSSDEIWLRPVLVGAGGSLATIEHALEGFADRPRSARGGPPPESGRAEAAASSSASASASSGTEASAGGGEDRGRHGRESRRARRQLARQEGPEVEEDPQADVAHVARPEPGAKGGAGRKQRRWGRAAGGSDPATPGSGGTGGVAPAPPPDDPAPSPVGRAQQCRPCDSGAAPAPAERGQQRRPYVFDMETGDPDDVLTLLFLASHPAVELRAVTITPGFAEQVALVRWLLQKLGLTGVRLGAQGWPENAGRKQDLSARFYSSFGRSPRGEPACERADQVLLECCDESVTLLTGGPLTNLGDALKRPGFHLGRWVAQGGFAGEGVVARDKQMDKFKGKEVCATWNFGGNVPAAQAALASAAIVDRVCVSKNVCHSVVYDEEWHAALGAAARARETAAPGARRAVAFRMMYSAMDDYLKHKPGGKKLHDPLALAVALDESVCELAEVKLFCQKGQWGSRLCPGSDTRISVGYDPARFQAALLG